MPNPNDEIIGSGAEINVTTDAAGAAFGLEPGAPGRAGNPPGARPSGLDTGVPDEWVSEAQWQAQQAPLYREPAGPGPIPPPAWYSEQQPIYGEPAGPPMADVGAPIYNYPAGPYNARPFYKTPIGPPRVTGLSDTAERPTADTAPDEYQDLFRPYTPAEGNPGSGAAWESRSYAPSISPEAEADALNAQLEDARYTSGTWSEYRGAIQRGYTGGARRFYVEGELYRRNQEAEENGEDWDEAAERERVESAFDSYRADRRAPSFSSFAQERDNPPPGYWENVRNGLTAWQGMNLGFAALQSGEGLERAFQPYLLGESNLPHQTEFEAGAAMIPLATTVIGSLAGARFGNPTAGAMVGNMLGSPLEGVANDWLQGHYFEQERGGLNLGFGRGEVEEVTTALKGMAGSVKDVTDHLDDLSKVAPVLPQSAGYFGGLSQAEGVNFTGAQSDTTDFLASSPFLYPSLGRYSAGIDPSTGRPTNDFLQSGDYRNLTMAAAATGHYQDVKGLEQNYAATLGDMETRRNYELNHPLGGGEPGGEAYHFLDNIPDWAKPFMGPLGLASMFASRAGSSYQGAINDEYDTLEAPLKAKEQASAAEADRLQAGYEGTVSAIDAAQSVYGVTEQGAQNLYLSGGGAAALRYALPGLAANASQGQSQIASQIATLQGLAQSDPANAGYYQQNIRELDLASEQIQGDYLSSRLRATTAGIGETGAYYTSEQAGLEYGLAAGGYQGATAQELRPLVGRVAASERSYAGFLNQTANDSSLPPELRYQLGEEAYGLQQTALAGEHDNLVQGYSQNLGRADIGIQRAGVGIQTAEAYGGVGDIGSAFGQEADAYKAKIAELTAQLQKGGLTQDEIISKTRDLTQAEGDLALARYQSFEATASREASLSSSAVSSAGAGASVTVSTVGGVAGIGATSGLASSQRDQAATYDQLAASAPNPEEAARYRALADQARASAVSTDLSMGTVPVSPALQERMDTAQGELARMQMGYATPGDMNDTRMGLSSDISAIIGQTRQEWQSALQKASPDEKDEINRQFNARVQDLETEKTRLLYESDQNFYNRIPTLSMGGPSFAGRYLPTDAQVAQMEDEMGYGRYGMRVHGYTGTRDFDDYITQPGSDMTTAGGSPAQTFPGNQSLFALSRMAGHDALAAGGHLPMPPIGAPTNVPAGPAGNQGFASAAQPGGPGSAGPAPSLFDHLTGVAHSGNDFFSYTMDVPWGISQQDFMSRFGHSPNMPTGADLQSAWNHYNADYAHHVVPPTTAPPLPHPAAPASTGAAPAGGQTDIAALTAALRAAINGATINIPGVGRGILQTSPSSTQRNMSDIAGMGPGHATGIYGPPTGTGD